MKWACYGLACGFALEKWISKALGYLEKAMEKGLWDKVWIEADPDLEGLRGDPRFNNLMAKYFVA